MLKKARPVALALCLVALVIGVLWKARPSRSTNAVSVAPSASAGPRGARPRASWGGFRGGGLSDGVAQRTESDRLGRLSGSVISSGSGRPIAGAVLTFVGPDGARAIETGAEGRFEFQPHRPGVHEIVSITKSGFFPLSNELGASVLRFEGRAGVGVSGVVLRLDPEVLYQGRVVDAKGNPVAAARVHIVGGDELELEAEGFSADHVSDDRGRFEFRAPDGALLEARHQAHGLGRARLDASAQISHAVEITLVPGPSDASAAIRGRVVDSAGEPRADVAVIARLEAENPARGIGPPPGRGRSDEQGRFALEGLAAGKYTLLAADGTSAPAVARGVVAGGPEVTLVLAAGATLEGKVTDRESGGAIAAFSVILSERRGPLAVDTVRAVAVFDAEGRYTVERLRPGRYLLEVAAKGYAASAAREIEIAGDTSADVGLLRGATLVGVVRDANTHAPLEGAKVSIEGRGGGGEGAQQLLPVAVSDAGGRFELSGLPPGQRSIFVAASRHHARVIAVVVDEKLSPIVIELTPTEPGEAPRIELLGIGAVLAAKDDAMLIGKVVAGGGAAEAGLAPGDAILAVDGASVVTLGFEGTIQRIRGPEGTSVSLLVRRGDGGAPGPVVVVRRRIKA
ncbi:MAG: carboxypeptidase regulatory-like domain-containing protein [Polyangiaceae bacterium]|nr:carboxypeptidase regulatory-like domain-containing protein [Polyangiaceae bacterium]